MMAHSGTSSRRLDSSISSRNFVEADWETKEALRQRELEEARARAAQMEKTMKWWSDCTANWREKWSKVRNERNKARDESKLLRSKLDTALKDANTYKREKQELESHNEQLRKDLERIHLLLLKHAGQWDHQLLDALDAAESERDTTILAEKDIETKIETCDKLGEKDSGVDELSNQGHLIKSDSQENGEASVDSGNSAVHCGDIDSWNSLPDAKKGTIKSSPVANGDDEFMFQKLQMLQLRLDETSKTLQIEREEKIILHNNLEKLEAELSECREKCEDLRASRQEAVRELLQLQDQHQDTVALIRADLMDEANSREGMDRRLADLRAQLERLQAENAAEWGKRERLETEKLALERENKRLRSEVRDAQDRLERRARSNGSAGDAEIRHLQQEVADKTKELTDLKHSHNKLKKIVSDKTTELAHMTRRAEQYEAEVKRLRSRVEELKRELAVAEDEVDSATNNIRKLQRTNDELQEQVENLQVQVEHLHTRMRSAVVTRRSPSPHPEEEPSEEEDTNY